MNGQPSTATEKRPQKARREATEGVWYPHQHFYTPLV